MGRKRRDAWENIRNVDAENNKRQYRFWEMKLHLAVSKGDQNAIEYAKKHLEYWITLI